MDKLLTDNVWAQIAKELKLAKRRLAAVAYVTSDRHLKLIRNDILVCDASDTAIKTGQTSATILQSLARKGVEVWSRSDLHAKAAVFGRFALIGSSNLSASSENNLTELSLLTDSGQIVAQIRAFIYGLRETSEKVDDDFLARILNLNVSPQKGGSKRKVKANRLGNKTWLIKVRELAEGRFPKEQDFVEQAEKKACSLVVDSDSTISHIRWVGQSTFRSKARPGDRVIQISTSLTGKRKSVIAPCTIVWRQDKDNWTRFYYEEPENCQRLTLAQFQKKAKTHGLTGISRGRELKPREILAHEMLWA
jgi:hypothetical protein